MKPEQVLPEIRELLRAGCDSLGLVSPSHVVPQVKALLDSLASEGLNPTVIHNGNAYDDPIVLAELAGKIDVYLPDVKYIDGDTANRLSGVSDYPVRAFAALEEMVRQVGDGLAIDGGGVARRGLIVRHLVLPGLVDDSIDLLRKLADCIGTGVHLSLMAQYYPPAGLTCPPPLDRRLDHHEYEIVAEEAMRLGFDSGWFQEPGSADCHNPDFERDHPFAT